MLLLLAAAPVRDRELLPVFQDENQSAKPDSLSINVEHSSVVDGAAVAEMEQLPTDVVVADQQLLPVFQDSNHSAVPDNSGIDSDQLALQNCAITDVGQQSGGMNLGTAMFYGTVRRGASSRKRSLSPVVDVRICTIVGQRKRRKPLKYSD